MPQIDLTLASHSGAGIGSASIDVEQVPRLRELIELRGCDHFRFPDIEARGGTFLVTNVRQVWCNKRRRLIPTISAQYCDPAAIDTFDAGFEADYGRWPPFA